MLGDQQLGGFDVTALVDGRGHEIRVAMEEFLSDRRPDDVALVYLSCHGLVDARRRLYFAATDTLTARLASTGVEARWLLDQLEECRARRQIVILDCCFSGAFAHDSKGDDDLHLGDRFMGQGRGRVVLTASRGTEYSFEGTPTARGGLSVFTNALADGIRTGAADTDHDGLISVDDAYAFAFDQMRTTAAQQTPQRWLYGAEGDILLARNPTAPEPTAADSTATSARRPRAPDHVGQTSGGSYRRLRSRRTRRRYYAGLAVVVLLVVAGVSWFLTRDNKPAFAVDGDQVTTSVPWRLHLVSDPTNGDGCTVTVTNVETDQPYTVPPNPEYVESEWQQHEYGTFKVEPKQSGCHATPEEGSGEADPPFILDRGDSEAFNPHGTLTVEVLDFRDNDSCVIALYDAENGQRVAETLASSGTPTVDLDFNDLSGVYLGAPPCKVRVDDDEVSTGAT